MPHSPRPMMILLVGPTDQEVTADQAARRVFDIGHVPIGVADLVRAVSSTPPPTSHLAAEMATRLMLHCDGVLRTPGASPEADIIIERARWEGKPVFSDHRDIPARTRQAPAG